MDLSARLNEIAPIEPHGGILVKRNDLIRFGDGINGLKAVGCLSLLYDALTQGTKTIVTLGARTSPQCLIISYLCSTLGLTAHLYMPSSAILTELQERCIGYGATIHPVTGGFNNQLERAVAKHAKDHPEHRVFGFGMSSTSTIGLLARQTVNIPANIKHITCPIGSGHNICALLCGLSKAGRTDISVTGVFTGAMTAPEEYIRSHAPHDIQLDLQTFFPDAIKPANRYAKKKAAVLGDLPLHPIYEGKCYDFLRRDLGESELLWIVGGPTDDNPRRAKWHS